MGPLNEGPQPYAQKHTKTTHTGPAWHAGTRHDSRHTHLSTTLDSRDNSINLQPDARRDARARAGAAAARCFVPVRYGILREIYSHSLHRLVP